MDCIDKCKEVRKNNCDSEICPFIVSSTCVSTAIDDIIMGIEEGDSQEAVNKALIKYIYELEAKITILEAKI